MQLWALKVGLGVASYVWKGLVSLLSLHYCYIRTWASHVVLVVKNPPANAGDVRDQGSNPGLGRFPKGGHGNPLQYSCVGNSMDRGAWWATVHKVAKSGHDWSDLALISPCSLSRFGSGELELLVIHVNCHVKRLHIAVTSNCPKLQEGDEYFVLLKLRQIEFYLSHSYCIMAW